MATECTTGVGRIVYGNPGKAVDKTDQKGVKILKDGQPIKQWSFGIAFPKAEFERDIWPAMASEIAAGFPNGTPPQFAMKYKDGDTGIDRNGKPLRDRDGYAGCYVLSVSTEAFAPPIFKLNDRGTYDQFDPTGIKTGDYVALGLNFVVNVPSDRTHTPSLYVNPTMVIFVGYGAPIISAAAVDPNQTLAGRTFALPPGASATPIGGTPVAGLPGAAPAPLPGGPAPVMPGAPLAAPMAPPPPAPAPIAPAGPTRPTDPSHIAHAGTPSEQWWNGAAWVPAPAASAPLPPPAPGFVAGALGTAPMPGAPAAPGGMPGMMPPRG
jgi:hypothetical protein